MRKLVYICSSSVSRVINLTVKFSHIVIEVNAQVCTSYCGFLINHNHLRIETDLHILQHCSSLVVLSKIKFSYLAVTEEGGCVVCILSPSSSSPLLSSLINVSGCPTYWSVHWRRQSIPCCSQSSVEFHSLPLHITVPPLSSSAVILNRIFSHFLCSAFCGKTIHPTAKVSSEGTNRNIPARK